MKNDKKQTFFLESHQKSQTFVNEALLDLYDFKKISKNSGIKCLKAQISEDGLFFASFLSSGETFVYDMKENKHNLFSRSLTVDLFEILPEEKIVIVHDNTIEFFSLKSKRPLRALSGHTSKILKIQFCSKKNILLSLSEDKCIIWPCENFNLKKEIHSRTSSFLQASFSKDGKNLIIALEDKTFLNFSLANFEHKKFSLIYQPAIALLEFSMDSKFLFLGGNFNYIIAYDVAKQQELKNIALPNGCSSLIKMQCFSLNLLSFLVDCHIFFIYNYENSQIILKFHLEFQKLPLDYSLSSKTHLILFLSNSGDLMLYDLQKLLSQAKAEKDKYKSLGFSEELFQSSLNEKKDFCSTNNFFIPNDSNTYNNNEKNNKALGAHLSKKSSNKSSNKFHTLKKTAPNNNNSKNEISRNEQTKNQFFQNLELSPSKLRSFLLENKRFPKKNRGIIWKSLLTLPENTNAFENLKKKGIHPAYQNLENNFPLDSQIHYNQLQSILSLLGYHCSFFTEVDYLPALVFPFVKLLGNNEILCFEIILTFLMNWGKDLFENFPHFPMIFLETIEDILKFQDYELYQHFNQKNLQFHNIIWPVFQANYTGILAKDDWVIFIDHVFSLNNSCAFYLVFLVSYLIYFRNSLLALQDIKGFNIFFNQQNAINIDKLLEYTQKILKSSAKEMIPSRFCAGFSPLTSPEYPAFANYPQIALDYHHKIREKIANEQAELLKRQQKIAELSLMSEELVEKEKKYRKRQENLLKLENERRERLLREESERLHRKIEEDRYYREKRIEKLKLLENTITNSLKNQEKLKEEELAFLQKELESRKNIDEFLLESRLEEETLLRLEFSMNQKVQEIMNIRNREERQRKLRQELDFKAKQEDFEVKLQEERWKNEDLEMNLRRELLKQQKLVHLNELEERNDDENIRQKLMLETFEKELKMLELERERKMRQIAEEETLKNEKLIETFKEQEQIAKKEDEKHLRTILHNEKQALLNKYSENIQKIQEANKNHEIELEEHRKRLKEIASVQKNAEFEAKVLEIKRENDFRLLEEERKMQEILYKQEEDQRVRNELKNSLSLKEQECKQRDIFYQSLRENQEKLLRNEKMRFEEYRKNYKEEMEKVHRMNEIMSKERLFEYEQRQKDNYNSQNDEKNDHNDLINSPQTGSLYNYSHSFDTGTKPEFFDRSKEKKDEILIQEDEGSQSNNYNYSPTSENDNRISLKTNGSPHEYLYPQYNNTSHEEHNHNVYNPQNKNIRNRSSIDDENNDNFHFDSPQYSLKNKKYSREQFENNYDSFPKIPEKTEEEEEKNIFSNEKTSFNYNFDYKIDEKEAFSPEFDTKKPLDQNSKKFEDIHEQFDYNEENEEESAREKERRNVAVDIDKPKYRSHSNTPDRYEVLEEDTDVFS